MSACRVESPPLLHRPRLVDRLLDLGAGGVALAHAPAGSGKSVWLRQLAASFAAIHHAEAVQNVWLYSRPVDVVSDAHDVLAAAGCELPNDADRPALLLLDDAQPSQTGIVNGLIQALVDNPSTPARLCVASRHELALNVVALRLANRLLEYDASDLALSNGELSAVADSVGAPAQALAPWVDELAGWPEPSARLCQRLAAQRATGMDDLVDECDDLLGDRIMVNLGAPAREFLLHVSVAATLTDSLVRELTGVHAAQTVFRDLARAGVPISCERAGGVSWRVHPLFRRYLLREARRSGIDTHHLHRQTLSHLGRQDRIAEALQHAVAGRQIDAAVDLVERGGGWRLVMKGLSAELSQVLEGISAQHASSAPNALLAKIFYLAKRGRAEAARTLFDGAMSRRAILNEAGDTLAIDVQLVDMHVAVYEDRAMDESDESQLHAIISTIGADDGLGRALALNHLCTVTLHLGKFALSQRYGEAAMALYEQAGAGFGALHLHAHLGQMRLARGDLDGAEHEYHLMATRALGLPQHASELVAIAEALRAEVAYEMNDIDRSKTLLERAMHSVEGSDAWLDVLAATYRVATRLAYRDWGLPGALSVLAHAEQTAAARGMPRLHRLIRIERIRALTLSDELDEAAAEIDRAGLAALVDGSLHEVDWALRQGSTAVTLARYLVRARRPEQALRTLGVAESNALQGGQLLAAAKLRVMRGAALWQQRSRPEAIAALREALRLLGKQPFRRFILDEGASVLAIAQAALDQGRLLGSRAGPLHDKLAELSHMFAIDGLDKPVAPATPTGETASDTDSRTARQHYLQLLAMGLSNKEIARIRGVSTNTVKYHLKRIFRELHVDSRSRAVYRASELGIIVSSDDTDARYPSG